MVLALLRHELRLFFLALQFFTRIPVPAWVGYDPAWMHASARHYPLVGLVVGGWGAVVLLLAGQMLPMSVAVLLSMAATAWLTGGFHEDGLADTCDGLGGSVSRERALTIMKDSRLGSYGALGLFFVLGLKAVTLSELAAWDALETAAVILWSHVASRALPVVLLWRLPYAGDPEHAKAKPMAQQISGRGLGFVLATVLLAAAALHTLLGQALPLATSGLALAAMGRWCARWYRQRLGGYTGDTLGASQQLGELAIYLAWLATVALLQDPAGDPAALDEAPV
ncbi:cobalamin-5'-phosphate synthase [Sphaerotilus hippei]|uniref:Adenosylcobinamide-GDP ribazoletransferase n=1 Tax=Sphaerotilus hippei TaxID=744406 RepID=A0A318GWF7_9BURK|nr:adenosylcobinamide-GDP ribazoletransferase [Sphaerotilus hippei]PXW93272.1 cobalamin-5'-phosphate synthase [Sphaerotilus hippei]